jgi:Mce-associated membrane protein
MILDRLNRRPILAALGIAAAVLFALVAWQGRALLSERTDDDSQGAAMRVAKDQVLDLTTLDADTVDDKLAALKKRTTGDFTRELDGITKIFVKAVTKSKLSATGEAKSVAIERYDGKRASVLVASTASVTSAEQSRPSSRSYRMRVSLVWTDDHWLIDGMEFVP